MRFRHCPLLITILLVTGGLAPSMAQPADALLDGTYWRTQGLSAILPAWTERARNGDGMFYAELTRDWTPRDSTTQYPGMVARHLFSYSAAYLMSGRETHLRHGEATLDGMIEHGWDATYGGWFNTVTHAGDVVDPEKDLFMQIYAITGLALYTIATRDPRARKYLRRTRGFIEEHAWDEEYGGYVDVLNRDGSVNHARKDFSPQLAPLSGYLLYLFPATRDSTYLRKARRIMDLTLTHMQGEDGWIRERFARDWTFLPDDSKNSHLNVGHNLEVAWLLLRLHALTGEESYRSEGLALTDQLLEQAFHAQTGAWRSKLKRTDPSQYRRTTTWWVQAYGNLLQLYAYRVTGHDRYRRAFVQGARFWNDHFVDEKFGGTILRAHLDGGLADGAKAVRTKTSYHAMEHSFLAYLYLALWTNNGSATLHYRVADADGSRLYPLPVEDTTAQIRRMTVNGTPTTPNRPLGPVSLPTNGSATLTIELTSPSPRP